MSEFKEVEKWIRLKRYEQPPEGYAERFLSEFHKRQRADLLKRSARSLFCERFATYCDGLGPQEWVVAAGAASAVVAVGYFALPALSDSSPASAQNSRQSPLWGQEITIEVEPADYLHPVLNTKAVEFDQKVVPVRADAAPLILDD